MLDPDGVPQLVAKSSAHGDTVPYPHPDIPYILDTDSSNVIGAVLSQETDEIERPIAFFSPGLGGVPQLVASSSAHDKTTSFM